MGRKTYITQFIAGELSIIGDLTTNRKLTNKDLTEIANTVQNGFRSYNDTLLFVRSLTLVQVDFPHTGNGFRTFIQNLTQIPHLTSLDFDKDSTYSHQFSAREIHQLSPEIAQAQHLQKLILRISWGQGNEAYQQIENDLASMLRTNQSLTDFYCDYDDNINGNYVLLNSILATPNRLTNVTLSLTPFPEYDDNLKQLLLNHPNITVVFEGNMTIKKYLQQEQERADRLQNMFQFYPRAALALQAPQAAQALQAAQNLRRARDNADVATVDPNQPQAKRARK